MYCVKCRKQTDTVNVQKVTTKNGRPMLRGVCTVCSKVKTQFIKTGTSVFNRAVNKLSFELHLPGHNFIGPGTRLDKRLNEDGTPRDWSKPINRVDKAAYHYDLCYAKHRDRKTRNDLCDQEMLTELSDITNPTLRERLDKSIVSNLINANLNLGLGSKKPLRTV